MGWYVVMVGVLIGLAFVNFLVAAVTSKSKKARLVIVGVFVLALIASFAVPFELLGRAKPAAWAWREQHVAEAEIRGVELREGVGIYLMLIVEGEPRLYVYPWNKEMAESIIQAMAQASQQGTSAMLGKPFDGASPFAPISEALNGIMEGLGGLFGGQGEGTGEQGEQGQGAAGDNSLEDRKPPMAYPKPQAPLPDKPRDDGGLIYPRN